MTQLAMIQPTVFARVAALIWQHNPGVSRWDSKPTCVDDVRLHITEMARRINLIHGRTQSSGMCALTPYCDNGVWRIHAYFDTDIDPAEEPYVTLKSLDR